MVDLFGHDRPEPRKPAAPIALSLIDAAAERAALSSGRAKSQHRTEILYGKLNTECHDCGDRVHGPDLCARCANSTYADD